MGLYARDGSLNVTVVSGDSELAGLYAPDGSYNVTVTGSVSPPAYAAGRVYPLWEGPFTTTAANTLLATVTYYFPYWFRDSVLVKTLNVRTTGTTQGVNSEIKLAIYASEDAALGARPIGAPLVFSNTAVATNTLSSAVSVDVADAIVPAGLNWIAIKTPLGGTPTKPSFFAMSSIHVFGAQFIGAANVNAQADIAHLTAPNLASADWETLTSAVTWSLGADRLGAPVVYIGT